MTCWNARLAGGAALILLTLAAASARAQTLSMVDIGGDFTPTSGFEAPEGLGGAAAPNGGETRIATLNAGFNLPLRLTDRAVLVPGVRYDLLAIRQEGAPGPQASQLHAVSASVLIHYRLGAAWDLTLRFAPTMAGDFGDFDAEHLQLSGMALVSYQVTPSLQLGAGLLVGNSFGTLRPLPAIRLRWQIVDRLRLEGLLPARAALVWSPHERLEFGLSASVRGQSFALTSEGTEGACAEPEAADRGSEACANRLAYSRGEVGPTVAVRLTTSMWFTVRAGFPFLRRYSVFTEGSDDPVEGRVDPNIVLRAQLTFRLPRS